MENFFEETALNVVGLDDSEWLSYSYANNQLVITIKNWSLQYVVVTFNGVISFIDWREIMYISKLYRNKSKTQFFEKSLSKLSVCNEDINHDNYLYKLFQFVDKIGDSCMQIVCIDFEFQIHKESEFKKL